MSFFVGEQNFNVHLLHFKLNTFAILCVSASCSTSASKNNYITILQT
jgi:hypothetical protein